MTRIMLLLYVFLYSIHGICGITVIGTRFIMNSDMKHLNIKVTNDNESDYLVKSVLDDEDFIISPPLFLLPKNNSSIITVILKEKKEYHSDKTFNLTLTSIPRSSVNNEYNTVSLAVRHHFKIIYRHAELQSSSFKKIKLRNQNDRCIIDNDSNFSFTVSVSRDRYDTRAKIINLSPHEKKQVMIENINTKCDAWVSFYDEYNDVIDSIKLTA